MKTFKLKISIKPELKNCINKNAEDYGLYDSEFEIQCAGYYAFKELCLYKGNLGHQIPTRADISGYYLINKLHKNIREKAWNAIYYIRKTYKIQKYE